MKQNKARCALLIFMFFLTFANYLAGLYITNIRTMFDYNIEEMNHFAIISSGTQISEYEKVMEKITADERITALKTGTGSYIYIMSIMGIKNGYPQYEFASVEDFYKYCDYMGISVDGSVKKDSLIMSRLAADNRGIELSENFCAVEGDTIDRTYTLDAYTDEEGYGIYYINAEAVNYGSYMLLPTGMEQAEFYEYLDNLENDYKISITTGKTLQQTLDKQLNSFYYLYFFVIISMAVVMAITVNAVFVGLYQHREREFAVYNAIGFTRKEVVLKLLKELVLLDAIGLAAGGAVTLLCVYLINGLYLIPHGMRLFMFNGVALLGLIICNAMVLFPLLVTRSRKLARADICEF